jgi:hypothetical protein
VKEEVRGEEGKQQDERASREEKERYGREDEEVANDKSVEGQGGGERQMRNGRWGRGAQAHSNVQKRRGGEQDETKRTNIVAAHNPAKLPSSYTRPMRPGRAPPVPCPLLSPLAAPRPPAPVARDPDAKREGEARDDASAAPREEARARTPYTTAPSTGTVPTCLRACRARARGRSRNRAQGRLRGGRRGRRTRWWR